ncbi:MAG: flagellar hook-basal body complex protein FliE [Lachnospiraceae bacterium]|nr:flagellar hook-basal body complex protein FliE [Lachnospiraceae bacterium]
MDITKLLNVRSGAVKQEADRVLAPEAGDGGKFSSFLNAAVNQLNETNSYLQNQENEEIKLALGLTDNTHDLAIAQAKAQASLMYTTALRDRFLEAYREIIQIQM